MSKTAGVELTEFLKAVEGQSRALLAPEVPQPRFRRRGDESISDWLAQVQAARLAAGEYALQRRKIVDVVAKSLYGTTAAEMLPRLGRPLRQWECQVTVPRSAQVGDLVPSLDGVAPQGPQPPASERTHSSVTVRVTSPEHPTNGVVRFHGGAFWMGGGKVSASIDRALIDQIADQANVAVFDVDYRLSPEDPYPAGVIDALCVMDAVREGKCGVEVTKLALLGTSSGANIAAIAAGVESHRRSAPPLAALALIVPSVLLHQIPVAMRDDSPAWEQRQEMLQAYLGSKDIAASPWVSPGVCSQLPLLPSTFAAIAEYDEVAAGGLELTAAIETGGGTATARVYPMTHTIAVPQVEASVVSDVASFLTDMIGST